MALEECGLPVKGSIRSEISATAFKIIISVAGRPDITPEVTDEKIERWRNAADECQGPCRTEVGCNIGTLLRTVIADYEPDN